MEYILSYDDIHITAAAFETFWPQHFAVQAQHLGVRVRKVRDDPARIEYVILCDWYPDGGSIEDLPRRRRALVRIRALPGGKQKVSLHADSLDPTDDLFYLDFVPTLSIIDLEQFFGAFIADLVHRAPVATPTKITELVSETEVGDILPDQLIRGGKYGTCRDLTIEDVRAIVARCLAFQSRGGKVPSFYEQLKIEPNGPRSFTLETLRGWLYNPRFAPKDT